MTHIHFPNDSVSTADRAFNYGDGCFSTIAVSNSKPELIRLHIKRLKSDTQRLGIEIHSWDVVEKHALSMASSIQNGVLKILISRGEGGRGYAPSDSSEASVWFSQHSMPSHYALWREQGIRLSMSTVQMAPQPRLAGVKHLNRLEQVLAKISDSHQPGEESVLCCREGFMVECSASNLFWKTRGIWYTPDLSLCGINGVMREQVLDLMHKNRQPVFEINSVPSELLDADCVFICNSLMGLVPVHQFSLLKVEKRYCLNTAKSEIQTLTAYMGNDDMSGGMDS